MPTANERARKTASNAANHAVYGGFNHFLSRLCGFVCFAFVTTATVLTLSLLHLTGEFEVDATLAVNPTYSENLAYFQPLHPDMPAMDLLSEMFVRQFITVSNTLYKDTHAMMRMWGSGGMVRYMSSPKIYGEFWDRVSKTMFDGDAPPLATMEPHIRRILKEGWNSWQIFFGTRTLRSNIETPKIDYWIATIQFRYYSYNAVMFRRLRNPMGFTVTQYHLARQKK